MRWNGAVALIGFFLLSASVQAKVAVVAVVAVEEPAPELPLFPADIANATPLTFELHLPLTPLKKLRPSATETYDAQVILADGTELPLQVSPRGKSRRKQCDFPPLRLDFKKKATSGTVFAGQNKLKLVTHCSKRLARGGYLAAEMLVYRLFNVLTPASFRVRAVEITYVDTAKQRNENWPGFLIEHKSQLAARLDGELLEVDQLALRQLQPEVAALVSLFAYMVGNTDFSLRMGPDGDCCHNAVPIQAQHVWVVPYDFDATGLVNAPYAQPAPAMNIRRVTQRKYRGYCDHNAHVVEVAANLTAQQQVMLDLVNTFDELPGLNRERVGKYLAEFFDVIDQPQAINNKLIKRCR